MGKPILGYWNIQGFAQPIRLLLKYAGVDFQDKLYEIGDQASFRDQFRNGDAQTLALDFPNLPYYIDGDFKITQTVAILRYLGKKHGLGGETLEDEAMISMVEQQLRDFFFSLVPLLTQDIAVEKPRFINNELPKQLALFSKFLGSKRWMVGSKKSYADFLAYVTFDWMRQLHPPSLEPYENLSAFMDRFESLPKIKEFRESKEFISWPLLGPVKFGFRRETEN